MTDIAISYASSRRAEALEVAAQLRAAGRTVWMDDQSETDHSLASIGVPVGLPHWSVISGAIDDALVLLVLDGPEWRASSYCRDEHAHALARGKRVAVVPLEPIDHGDDTGAPLATWPVTGLDGPGGLLERFDEDLDVVLAHDRLLQASLSDDSPSRRANARLVRDVRLVEQVQPSAGITVTESLASFAATVTQAARRRRTVRGALASILVVAVVSLTAMALLARSAGIAARESARRDAARQASLALAADARRAETTLDQEHLAAEAVTQARTQEALAAQRSAATAAAGLRRYRHHLGAPYTVDMTDDGRFVILGTGDNQLGQGLARLDLRTGEASPRILFDGSAIPWMTKIAPDGSWAVFATPSRSDLWVVSLITAKQKHLINGFSAFTIGADGSLWWSEPDGQIHRMSNVFEPDGQEDVGRLPGHVTAMSLAASDHELAILQDDGHLTRLKVTRSSGHRKLDVVDEHSLFQGVANGFGTDDRDATFAPDLLLTCGSSVVAYRGNTWAALTPSGIEHDEYQNPSSLASSVVAPGPACVGDAAVSVLLRPPPETAPSDAPLPVGLERDNDGTGLYPFGSDRSGEHLVVARADGIVDVFTLRDQPTEEPWDAAVLTLPLPGGEVVATKDDELWWRDEQHHRTRIGSLASSPQLSLGLAVQVGDLGALGTEQGITVVGRSGVKATLDLPTAPTALTRAGAGIVIAAGHDLTQVKDLAEVDKATTKPVKGLARHEAIWGVANAGGRTYVTTNTGRVLAINPADGSIVADAEAGPSLSPIGVVAIRQGDRIRVITYGADGIVRSFDRSLEETSSMAQPGTGRFLAVSRDGRRLLAGTINGALFILDSATLQVEQHLADDVLLPWGYGFSNDSGSVVGVRVLRTAADEAGEISWRDRIQEFPLDNQ
ncbi:MAG: TIR domain-containing protein [Acidimicrobiales bacterium]